MKPKKTFVEHGVRFHHIAVSEETFTEIRKGLEAAGWTDSILKDENGRLFLYMDGIGLVPKAPTEELRLLKAKEAAKILRLSTDRVYRLARAGKIPSVVLGGRTIRFRDSDLRDLMKPSN